MLLNKNKYRIVWIWIWIWIGKTLLLFCNIPNDKTYFCISISRRSVDNISETIHLAVQSVHCSQYKKGELNESLITVQLAMLVTSLKCKYYMNVDLKRRRMVPSQFRYCWNYCFNNIFQCIQNIIQYVIKLWTCVILISALATAHQCDAINIVIQIEHKHSVPMHLLQ